MHSSYVCFMCASCMIGTLMFCIALALCVGGHPEDHLQGYHQHVFYNVPLNCGVRQMITMASSILAACAQQWSNRSLLHLAQKCLCSHQALASRTFIRSYTKNSGKEPVIHPYAGEYRGIGNMFKSEIQGKNNKDNVVPKESDVVIVGGGAIGMSVAYFLKQGNPEAFNVTVVEKDPTYTRAATALSVGGLRQQFSLPENIQMSMFTAEFLRNIKEHLSVLDLDPPDVCFNPQGYLFLASADGVDIMKENHKIQCDQKASVALMSQKQLGARFPWLNLEGVEMGSYGLANEGWFDPWLFLAAMKTKAASLGVQFVKGEVTGFKKGMVQEQTMGRRETLDHVHVKVDGENIYPIHFSLLVNCAGPWSGEVARMAGIGSGEGALSVPLPVEPRKRYVYLVHCPDGPGLETPMLIDPSGVYVRREGLGGCYVCGASPPEGYPEPSTSTFDVDYDFFHEYIWPILANRIPAFESLKLRSAWAGFYDYNYFDQNLVIGNHPYFRNFFMATGCSGHGIQQAPAIGRAVREILLDNEFSTIDLSRFSFDRFLSNDPVFERNIV